jgi:hypothetical protein
VFQRIDAPCFGLAKLENGSIFNACILLVGGGRYGAVLFIFRRSTRFIAFSGCDRQFSTLESNAFTFAMAESLDVRLPDP